MFHRENDHDLSDLDERSVMLYRKIFPILTAFDSAGLIKLGTPLDEYHYEAKMIAELLSKRNMKVTTVQDVLDDVDYVFYQQFETYISYPNFATDDYDTIVTGENDRRIVIGEKESFRSMAITIYKSIAILN